MEVFVIVIHWSRLWPLSYPPFSRPFSLLINLRIHVINFLFFPWSLYDGQSVKLDLITTIGFFEKKIDRVDYVLCVCSKIDNQ